MRIILIVTFLMAGAWMAGELYAQARFADEIRDFQTLDSLNFPGTGKIVFTGSSSFRMWEDMQRDFPDHPLINRGFGGSTLPDLLTYKEILIKPYKPRQVVIYCGENDVASGATPQQVLEDFTKLFRYIREEVPSASIVYVSMKPSPSRSQLIGNIRQGNELIRDFLQKKPNTRFVDVFTPMLDAKGNIRPELFLEDQLHMNRDGYAIWKRAILPYLK